MAVIVNQSSTWVQGAAYIGYDNLMSKLDSVVTATHEDEGYPIINAVSWPTYERWQCSPLDDFYVYLSLTTAQEVNSYGYSRHNLTVDDGSAVAYPITTTLQYSTDEGATWVAMPNSARTASNRNESQFYVADAPVSAAYWRIKFTGTFAYLNPVFFIGNIFIGNSLRLYGAPENGFTPPDLAMANEYISNESDGGDYLGRTLIRKAGQTQFTISNVPETWVTGEWLAAMHAIERHPFYFSWDAVNHPTSVAYCYVEKSIAKPRYTGSKFMSFSLKFRTVS